MATAGSGDVLTGIIAGLRAQKYDAIEASLLGVYLHGLAGDYAKEKYSEKSLVATDIIENISEAYKYIL
ncbi:MAG TPA: NAD(P)H-hydrate dehydratase, partial [Paludibacteraceae bacterium]|nr:NAD(P)H-hydrate dehydratase [Paludibacteraceae bacterium]